MLTLYAVEYSGQQQCYQHTVLVKYDKVPNALLNNQMINLANLLIKAKRELD